MNARGNISIGAIARCAFWGALAMVATTVPAARSQELNKPVIDSLRVGFDGHYKAGHWAPVELIFLGGSSPYVGHVRLTVPDGDGTPSTVTTPRPVQLLPGKRTRVVLYAKFGDGFGDMRVQFRADDRNVIDERLESNGPPGVPTLPLAMQPDEKLIVTLGPSIGVEDAVRLHQTASGNQAAVAVLRDANDLPTEWYGYDGVDWLVISTTDPALFSKMLDTGAPLAALEQWIHLGGNLLITSGAQASLVFAPDAPLSRFAPGRVAEQTTLRRTTDLESYVGGSRKVRPGQGELALSVPRLEDVVGKIEVADGNRPLVVRSPRRLGQVAFVAVDLDQRPFIDWEGRGTLVARCLGLAEPGASDAAAKQKTTGMPTGVQARDLLDGLNQTLDNFQGVTPIPFAAVAVMILGYIVLIGPGDYFLVKKLLKRMELTWITFPLWVILVSAGAYALARYTKGDDLRINQVDLIDVDVQSGWARGTSWMKIFSPQSEAFHLACQPREPSGTTVAQSDRLFAWLGTGQLGIAPGAGSVFAGRYDFSPQLDELVRVPVQVWSTKGFLSRTSYKASETVTADLTQGPDGVPEGTLRNELSIPLRNCLLLSGSWAYVLGEIKPGDRVKLTPGEQRDLRHVLRDANQNGPNQYVDQATRQTWASVGLALQPMLFFKAAGGEEAIAGSNGSQHYVDLSPLLSLDRAILVGRAPEPATQLTNGGEPLSGPEDQHWTVYRFVFPVARPDTARE